MINTIIMGAAGRMGKRLVALVQESATMQLAGAIENPGHPALNRDAGEEAGSGRTGVIIQNTLGEVLQDAQVIIDFTAPQATLLNLQLAVSQKKAMVIGTTGFDQEELQQLKELAKEIPCVFAPNMSVGVNVLLSVVGKVAKALGETYNIEVIEAHHNQKKDAPSGTALKIAEVLAGGMDWNLEDVGVYERHGIIGQRKTKEIGIQTVRAGDIIGDHTVLFGGPGERIEITHRAHTRDTFAMGALRAAEWVVTQPPGLYTMADVLDLA
ncbi:MAG: 4-hydroxy-tetrahydrodipicolinate reductase [Nitrospirales bacterium]|nr:MAG: 4-hydroxy-tetrahydrodipicolinate reductase [Nitrospirales bacterium]